MTRCAWADTPHVPMQNYHDQEWGVPLHGDRAWFEFLCLEGAQAGLSWRTVLDKRARYREVFHGFDIEQVAAMDDAALEGCLTDPGIIRNRRKTFAIRDNARAALRLIDEHGRLDTWFWACVDDTPVVNHWRTPDEVPASTALSDRMARELKRRGFRFVGSTICYALMQATGLVNDHLVDCFRHAECARLADGQAATQPIS